MRVGQECLGLCPPPLKVIHYAACGQKVLWPIAWEKNCCEAKFSSTQGLCRRESEPAPKQRPKEDSSYQHVVQSLQEGISTIWGLNLCLLDVWTLEENDYLCPRRPGDLESLTGPWTQQNGGRDTPVPVVYVHT